ncbi:MAG: hypothetical protein LUE13_06690 [Akkermansiaceae bacterium]|nr:hypothetical protein [Akkermansiaceae bacterium]
MSKINSGKYFSKKPDDEKNGKSFSVPQVPVGDKTIKDTFSNGKEHIGAGRRIIVVERGGSVDEKQCDHTENRIKEKRPGKQ